MRSAPAVLMHLEDPRPLLLPQLRARQRCCAGALIGRAGGISSTSPPLPEVIPRVEPFGEIVASRAFFTKEPHGRDRGCGATQPVPPAPEVPVGRVPHWPEGCIVPVALPRGRAPGAGTVQSSLRFLRGSFSRPSRALCEKKGHAL